MWAGVNGLIQEIKKCEVAGATTSSLAMAYICIDTMAYLASSAEREVHNRTDFINWVDTYLKGLPQQPYQYNGMDVYGARCALLHAFSSEVNFHQANLDTKIFGYHDGGLHILNHEVSERLILIGTASFINDVVLAVSAFMEASQLCPDLRARVEARLPKVLANFPISFQ
jgi:hypothetical protein